MAKLKIGIHLIALVLVMRVGVTPPTRALSPDLPDLPSDWHITASTLVDVTGDGAEEWALLVWRPWSDWPIQQWSSVPSPISGFHDAQGQSCHLILVDPHGGREIWAGSALPVPLLSLAVDDIDRDGEAEVLTVEGSYAEGRDSMGTHVSIWSWTGFGFTLEWRSSSATFVPSCLSDIDRCGIREQITRSQGGH
jgi:hypothetical protein